MHPKGTPGPTQNSAENAIFVKFGRNFCMCRMGAPHPKIFGPHKVMTLIYFHVKYLWVTPKTRWDTPFQSLTTFERFFVDAKKSLFSIPLRNPLRTAIFRKKISKINPFFLWGGSDLNQGSEPRGMTPKYRALKFGVGRCTPKAHMRPNLWGQPKFWPKSSLFRPLKRPQFVIHPRFFCEGSRTQTKTQNLESWPQNTTSQNLGSPGAPQRHMWYQVCGFWPYNSILRQYIKV